ncbi:MAG TPA: TatD family hydrolase [Nitrosopumilaceae archaeon]|nr:TatD family hydrolase [Nitrosopumilaceae archaeon]
MTWLFDSHIHLSDPEYEKEISLIIKSMEKLQIKACCVSMDNSNSIQTLNLATKSKLILPFIGIHPEKFKDNLEGMIDLIKQNNDKISGIGEIGLDETYVKSDDEYSTQKHVFETLLSVAEKYKKPVSIHSRKTLDDIFEIISSYSLSGVLLHWFDGNKKQLQKAMDMKFFVSYGPVMLYANDKQILLSKTDQDKILVETDGPVRFSKCFGFKPAQITFIPSVIFCASKILRKSYDELTTILEKNSMNYLGI